MKGGEDGGRGRARLGKPLAAVAAALLLAADQLTKLWAAESLPGAPAVLIPGVLELRYLENSGAAFGLMQDSTLLLAAAACVFLVGDILIAVRLPRDRFYDPLRLVCVLIGAGAAGNLLDRLVLGYVRDFVYIALIDFPIFNVADIYVTCAALLACILVLTRYKDVEFKLL